MRTLRILAVVTLLSAPPTFAQQRDYSKVQIKVTKVAGSVHMLEVTGGNIAASVGDVES